VTRLRLSRIFWIGAAATLVVAALIGVAGLLRSDFTETDGKILLTLLTLLVAGGAAVAGLALVERASFAVVGWFATVVAVASFVLITAATWSDFDNDGLTKIAGIAAITLVATLLVATQLLLHRGRFLAVVAATGVTLSLAVAGTAIGILGESESDELWKAVGTFWILGLLGWLLVPVLQRFTAAGAPTSGVRVLAALDGVELVASREAVEGLQIEAPATGERLVLRRQAGAKA
jgi:MFS family permease